jgi:hypothetical protein
VLSALTPLIVLAGALSSTAAPAGPTAEQAQEAAADFGRALTRGEITILRPLLPERGKVRLRLMRMAGPEEGAYSPGQVEALLGDFLKRGSVESFKIVRDEGSHDGYALVHGLARIVCAEGHRFEVHLHLTFEPEQGRWILREIRESPP